MTETRLDLNGSWIGSGTGESGELLKFEGIVPGCVHTDLIKNKVIDYDIFWRDNHNRCQWIERNSFTYTKVFILEEEKVNARLHFEGLDTYCDIFLNGNYLGSCENMFLSYVFDVDDCLCVGENRLEVVFQSPLFTEQKKKRNGAFTTERLYTRRIQCTYGWDWVARFVTMGICKEVFLTFGDEMRISDVYIYTKEADQYSAQVVAELYLDQYEKGEMIELSICSPQGQELYRKRRYCREKKIREYIDLFEPQPWWPNGYGAQPLYRLKVTVGKQEVYEQTFGIVTSRIVQKTDECGSAYEKRCLMLQQTPSGREYDQNETYSGFQLLVNGTEVMCKGANWVPCEPFPSEESEEKMEHLLRMARDCGMNMIRIWGGGIFEQDCFYDLCDRLGIMVTQDFLMACGEYPEDEDAFLNALRKEAKHAAIRLRNHPCLMWWTGDNENAVRGSDESTHFSGRTAALQALEPVISKYDPQRRFLLSSPWGGKRYASKTVGTTHNTQFLGFLFDRLEEDGDYKEFLKEFQARFIAEEPSFGASERISLQKFMTEEDIVQTEDMWLCHTKTNPGLEKELFVYAKQFAEKMFGPFRDGEDRLFKLKYLQYEWIRVSLEQARRNHGFCSGIIYWMLNDCWPAAAGWSIIDYYGYPKAAYYSFKRCAKKVIASVDKEADQYLVYVCSDDTAEHELTVKISILEYVCGRQRVLSERQITCAAASASVIETIPCDSLKENEILLAEVSGSGCCDRAFYKNGNLNMVKSDQVRIERSDAPEERTMVTVTADTYVHAVCLEGDCQFEDNYFSLMPGESRTIKCLGKTETITVHGFTV